LVGMVYRMDLVCQIFAVLIEGSDGRPMKLIIEFMNFINFRILDFVLDVHNRKKSRP
jgi:hypothetical protein